jgi:hypothetical protein
MTHAQRFRGLRLGVAFEAESLIANVGSGAYAVACMRATEASSDDIARDWSDVASMIRRRGRRARLMSALH